MLEARYRVHVAATSVKLGHCWQMCDVVNDLSFFMNEPDVDTEHPQSDAERSPGRGPAPSPLFFSSDAARLFPVSATWPSAGKTASSGVKVRPASLLDSQIQ